MGGQTAADMVISILPDWGIEVSETLSVMWLVRHLVRLAGRPGDEHPGSSDGPGKICFLFDAVNAVWSRMTSFDVLSDHIFEHVDYLCVNV